MTWTWAKYVDQRTTEAIRNPRLHAFGTAFLGFFAGCELISSLTTQTPRSFRGVALDCFVVGILLSWAALEGYFLERAIRQVHSGGVPSSAEKGF
jgi:hypothetical protein